MHVTSKMHVTQASVPQHGAGNTAMGPTKPQSLPLHVDTRNDACPAASPHAVLRISRKKMHAPMRTAVPHTSTGSLPAAHGALSAFLLVARYHRIELIRVAREQRRKLGVVHRSALVCVDDV